jgi:hypothetical protein
LPIVHYEAINYFICLKYSAFLRQLKRKSGFFITIE